ncbi:MAG: nitrogen regulation protein NR(II) [Ignavibacteriaceae bacterium]
MNTRLNKKPFAFFLLFVLSITVITHLIVSSLRQWKEDIIRGKQVLSEVVVEKLEKAAGDYIDSLHSAGFFDHDSFSVQALNRFDDKLKKITSRELIHIPGMEGGFFFPALDEFYGYAFPTSPPPIPAFGPPPRSYNIIKSQALESAEKDSLLSNLHSFDPAVFPLATKPVKVNSKTAAVVWARIHVERELPALKLNTVLQIAGIVSIAGFLVTFFVAAAQRKKIRIIKSGLQKLETDTSYRLPEMSGSYGSISDAVNKLVSRITEMHLQKQHLEKELYHQDKLATLGKLIAGVAHEVKTPLAIIKTRIQIWEHTIRKKKDFDNSENGIPLSEIKIVVDEIDRLTKLVKRLLVFSKPVSDNFQTVNINKQLMQTISLIQIEGNTHFKITTNLSDSLPLVRCDPNALEQVFINILANSLEAMKESPEIIVNSFFDKINNNVVIEIVDNGSGIPQDILDKVFDPFFTTKEHGAGLGLSIAYEVIKAFKGKIIFSPNSPDGTKCSILLPRNPNEK